MYDAPNCGIESAIRARNLISVRDTFTEFKAFPNPTNGKLFIEIPHSESGRIQVFNSVGVVIDDRLIGDTPSFQLDLIYEIPGVYFVKMQTESKATTKKIILTD